MNRGTIAVIAIFLVGAVVWSRIERARVSIHVAFADDQTEVFAQMTDKALHALHQSPPDLLPAVEYLEYLHNYYPSGTKQTRDSIRESSPE